MNLYFTTCSDYCWPSFFVEYGIDTKSRRRRFNAWLAEILPDVRIGTVLPKVLLVAARRFVRRISHERLRARRYWWRNEVL